MKTTGMKVLIGVASVLAFTTVVHAAPSKHVQQHCVGDYKKYCGEWGLESKGLRNCMNKHGDRLTNSCVAALVKSGEVSQTEVERRKKAASK